MKISELYKIISNDECMINKVHEALDPLLYDENFISLVDRIPEEKIPINIIISEKLGSPPFYDHSSNTISINPTIIELLFYYDENEVRQPLTMARAIIHETSHASQRSTPRNNNTDRNINPDHINIISSVSLEMHKSDSRSDAEIVFERFWKEEGGEEIIRSVFSFSQHTPDDEIDAINTANAILGNESPRKLEYRYITDYELTKEISLVNSGHYQNQNTQCHSRQ